MSISKKLQIQQTAYQIINIMRFFSIGPSDDLKIIGHYPQTDFRMGYNPDLPNSHWKVKPDVFPDFLPNYELELNKDAFATNLIQGTGGYHGMLIDSKFREIIEKFKLPPHKFYPINVYHRGNRLNYFWFHYIMPNLWENIDLENSKICIKHTSNFENYINLPVIEEKYVKKLAELSLSKFSNNFEYNIIPDKIILNSSFQGFDIVEIKHLYYNPLISFRLRKMLYDNELTGFVTKLYKPLIPYKK